MIQNWLTQEEFDAAMLEYERLRNEKEVEPGFRVMDGNDVVLSIEYLLDGKLSGLLSDEEIEFAECRVRRFLGESNGEEYVSAKILAGIKEGDMLPWYPDVLRSRFNEKSGGVK